MNSKKIVNTLIVFFLLINMMLFVTNHFYYKNVRTISKERLKMLERVLEKKNIELNASIPKSKKMRKLYLAKPNDREKELVDKVFKNGSREGSYIEGVHKHTDDNETLIFNKSAENGRVFYLAKEPKYKLGRDARGVLDEFIEDFKVDDESYESKHKVAFDDYEMHFMCETYEGENIFCNELIAKLNKDGIVEARTIRYNPIKFGEKMFDTLPIDEILYTFAYEMDFEEKVKIEKIILGYYTNFNLAGSGYSFPVDPYYLIYTDGGVQYYINAITGKML